MSRINENDPVFQEAKKKAIAFYENEHELTTDERKDLYVFYEELFRRTLLTSSIGFATGVTIPFVLKKKGNLVNPLYPIALGFVGLTLTPSLIAPSIYSHGVTGLQDKYGADSRVDKVVQVTPDPIAKSFFWSNYFKRSAEDPSLRIKDPRSAEAGIMGFPGEHPKNGVPEFEIGGKESQSSNPELTSAWDKVRVPDSRVQHQANSLSTTPFERPQEGAYPSEQSQKPATPYSAPSYAPPSDLTASDSTPYSAPSSPSPSSSSPSNPPPSESILTNPASSGSAGERIRMQNGGKN